MQENQNFVFGGLDTDSDLRTVKSDRYVDANDVEHFVDDTNELGGVRRMKGTKLAYTIPSITPKFSSYRIPFITSGNTDYQFTVTGSVFSQFAILNVAPNAGGLSSLGSFLETSLEAVPTIASATSFSGAPYQTAALSNGAFRVDINNSQTYSIKVETRPNGTTDWIEQPVILLAEPISYTAEMQPLSSVLLGDKQIVLSKAVGQSYCEIGCAIRDISENWTYTSLLGSTKLNLPTTEYIDIRAELLGNNQIGVYWVDSTNKPKVFYFNEDLSTVFRYYWGSIGGLDGVYLNKNGIYNLNNIDIQTNLQIFNNKATVEVVRQIATGGALKTGGKRYYVRFGVNGTENTTPFNEIGEYTIVYKADNVSQYNAVKIKGDLGGEATTKQIVLRVNNCMADVFNYFELVCVEYAGGATSALLVDRYDITAETTEITHSGNELNSQPFDVNAILNVKPVILKGKTNEVKKNRYNIANVEIDGDSDAYAEIASKIKIESARKEISRVGEVYSGQGAAKAFQVSNYKTTPKTGGNEPLSKSSTFYTLVPYNVNENPFDVFDTATGTYTSTITTSGVNNVTFNFSISSDRETSTSGIVSSGSRVDFASVTVYHLNADNTVKAVLYTEEFRPKTRSTTSPLNFFTTITIQELSATKNLELLVTLAAGEKVRADWFVQGNTQWDIQSNGFSSVIGTVDALNFGKQFGENEYQKAENVANNMGYMLYEEYPFYIKFHKKSGYVTAPYYIGTHTILPVEFAPTKEYIPSYGVDVSLTTPSGNPYVYYVKLNKIDLSSIRDEISGFSIWRGDLNNPKVLACGVNLMANNVVSEGFYAGFYASNPTGILYGSAVPFGLGDISRRYSGFIAPDNIVKNGELIKFQTGDRMYMAGQPTIFAASANNNIASSKGQRQGSFVEYTGYCPRAGRDAMPLKYAGSALNAPARLEDAVFTPFRETSNRFIYNNISGVANPTKMVLNRENQFKPSMSSAALAVSFLTAKSPVLARESEDYGVYLAYYYRGDNKLDIENINVVDCNAYYDLTNDVGATEMNGIEVFGGDTFTQKNYLRVLYSATAPNTTNVETATKYESFISFYTQNRFNTQMRRTVEEGCVLFPADANSITEYLDDEREEFYLIDEGYNQQNNKITSTKAYSDKLRVQTKFPTRIYYTSQRPTGSSYDSFRDIAPLDFKDLDGKNGQISALYDINDTMIAVQKYAVTVLPYQADVLLRTDNGSEIYVGNGGVYAQRESIIGTYGTDIQTNSFRGFNKNGNASLYWLSEVTKKVFRYGRDGIQCLSDNAKTRNFFLSRTKLIENEFDCIMGFDTKRDNLWITAKAYKENVPKWNSGADYFVGNVIQVSDTNIYGYPLFFIAIQDNSNLYPLTNTEYWEQIPLSNGDYYSIFTILFNEKLNTFTTLSGALPDRYLQYNNELLVPNVKSAWGKVYELNNGEDKYFDNINIDFFIEPVTNKIQNVTKRFVSIGINTDDKQSSFPNVLFTTNQQNSTGNEFERKNGNIWIPVEPDSSEEPMLGEWMKFKISSDFDITLLDCVSKFYYRPRLPR
jgi:hypothetical protein